MAGAGWSGLPAVKPAGFDMGNLTKIGGSGPDAFSMIPPQFRDIAATGFHQAFSIAIANSMMLGVIAAALACVTLLALREKPLRTHFHAEQAAHVEQQMAHRARRGPAAAAD